MATSQISQPVQRQPFDAIAEGYDAAFTRRPLGRWYRYLVWEFLDAIFQPGQSVLELGCGTGEDAIRLARKGVSVTATDVSTEMLDIAKRKAANTDLGNQIAFAHLDLRSLVSNETGNDDCAWLQDKQFDGVFANFGPMNCVSNRRALTSRLARLLRPGGRVILVMMGPVCPWEIAWHLGHARGRTAFRRLRSGAHASIGGGASLPVWYPTHRRIQREFSPAFTTLEVAGLGLLLPPAEMTGVVRRAPRLFRALSRIDRRRSRALPWRWLNDHYLIVLERQ